MNSPSNQPLSNAPQDSGAKDTTVPIWLIVVCFLLLYWGAVYFDEHGGWFDPQVYTPYVSAEQVQNFQVGGGETSFERGRKIYGRTCIACHQANALGTPGTFPPLAGSDWVNEKEPGRMIRIVLHGFQGGGLVVNGKPFSTGSSMTAFGLPPPVGLTDEEIADVITFVRGNAEWGNKASPVTPEQVTAIRAKTATHGPFSPAEILTVNPGD
ncbi:MAG TPA: cytochrome c [Verrucomicrobiae bacterium]|nr:cytochrome c [Verrucomicrobiae bacterium]